MSRRSSGLLRERRALPSGVGDDAPRRDGHLCGADREEGAQRRRKPLRASVARQSRSDETRPPTVRRRQCWSWARPCQGVATLEGRWRLFQWKRALCPEARPSALAGRNPTHQQSAAVTWTACNTGTAIHRERAAIGPRFMAVWKRCRKPPRREAFQRAITPVSSRRGVADFLGDPDKCRIAHRFACRSVTSATRQTCSLPWCRCGSIAARCAVSARGRVRLSRRWARGSMWREVNRASQGARPTRSTAAHGVLSFRA